MAVTREEELLNSLANGVPSDITPITREEQYLSYIGGGSYSYPLEPITRKEALLKNIAEKGVSGGSGVTIRNQNKTITENGTYTADEGYTGLGTVTVEVPNKLSQYMSGTMVNLTSEDLGTATAIKANAFLSSTTLVSVELPPSVEVIQAKAFSSCNNLITVEFSEGLDRILESAFRYTRLTELHLPASLTSIASDAFASCQLLKTVTFSENSALETIGSYVFEYCYALTSVTMKATTPPTLGSNVFSSCNALEKIIVPVGCAEAYKSATNWSAYAAKIVEEGA